MKKKRKTGKKEYMSLVKRSRERVLMPPPKEFANRKAYRRRDVKKALRAEEH